MDECSPQRRQFGKARIRLPRLRTAKSTSRKIREIDMGELTVNEEATSGLPVNFGNSSLAVSLARAEVDQQITTAHAYPRSIARAVKGIMTLATLDEQTAEECVYALPRGGKAIKGPSIRFAEIIGSQWG